MRVAVNAGTYLVARHAGIEPHKIVAVCHYRLDGTVSKREYTSDDTLLDLLHLAVLGTLLYDRLDLGLGNLRVGLLQMEDARHELDASRQQPYERRRHHRQCMHRPRHGLGHTLGGIHAYAFGHQLAEDDRKVCHHNDDCRLRHCRRRCQRHTQPRQYHTETVCKRSARIDTRKDTYERDSDLHRREETVRILRKAQRQLGRAATLRRLSLEIRLARRDKGHLRHGEDAV